MVSSAGGSLELGLAKNIWPVGTWSRVLHLFAIAGRARVCVLMCMYVSQWAIEQTVLRRYGTGCRVTCSLAMAFRIRDHERLYPHTQTHTHNTRNSPDSQPDPPISRFASPSYHATAKTSSAFRFGWWKTVVERLPLTFTSDHIKFNIQQMG